MNTLTDLIPDIYAALNVVSRELSGFIPAVTMDARADRAAVGQPVRVASAPAAAAEDITAATNPPDTGDQTFGNTSITITKARAVPFRWTGEEQLGVNNGGPGYLNLRQQQVAQALRTLVNEVEADLGGLYYKASRAFGTAGTTPFGSTIKDLASALQILEDNGAPDSDLQLVLNSAAGVNIRGLPNLFKVNEAGDDSFLRQGAMGDLYGTMIRKSAGVKSHTAGTGSGFLINDAGGLSEGDTTIAVDTGTGTILQGDVVAFGGHKYLVNTALAGGDFAINDPGVRAAVADNTAVALSESFAANMLFHRGAMVLAARSPALPEEGDAADDRMMITDPRTGLTFELSQYRQYRRVRYEIGLAWGVQNIKPEHTALMLG